MGIEIDGLDIDSLDDRTVLVMTLQKVASSEKHLKELNGRVTEQRVAIAEQAQLCKTFRHTMFHDGIPKQVRTVNVKLVGGVAGGISAVGGIIAIVTRLLGLW